MMPFDPTTDGLDQVLRQLFSERPVPLAPTDLAHRARGRATEQARANLKQLQKVRNRSFVMTLIVAVAIIILIAHAILAQFASVAQSWWSVVAGSSSAASSSTGEQWLVVAVSAAVIAIVGEVFVGPAFRSDEPD